MERTEVKKLVEEAKAIITKERKLSVIRFINNFSNDIISWIKEAEDESSQLLRMHLISAMTCSNPENYHFHINDAIIDYIESNNSVGIEENIDTISDTLVDITKTVENEDGSDLDSICLTGHDFEMVGIYDGEEYFIVDYITDLIITRTESTWEVKFRLDYDVDLDGYDSDIIDEALERIGIKEKVGIIYHTSYLDVYKE